MRIQGIISYLQRKTYNDFAIANFAFGLIAHSELSFYMGEVLLVPVYASNPIIDGVMSSLQCVEANELNELLDSETIPSIWIAAFKLHYFLRK